NEKRDLVSSLLFPCSCQRRQRFECSRFTKKVTFLSPSTAARYNCVTLRQQPGCGDSCCHRDCARCRIWKLSAAFSSTLRHNSCPRDNTGNSLARSTYCTAPRACDSNQHSTRPRIR